MKKCRKKSKRFKRIRFKLKENFNKNNFQNF